MSDWPIVLATLVGPVAAVVITLWYQHSDRAYQRKLAVFSAMMKMRRHTLSVEFVGALNILPVEFSNVTKVMQKHQALLDLFGNTAWSSGSDDVIIRLVDDRDARITELLSEMARDLRIKVGDLQILRNGYAPKGWTDEEDMQRRIRFAVSEIITGKASLPIRIDDFGSRRSATDGVSTERSEIIDALLRRKP